jgi:hypothetical protein
VTLADRRAAALAGLSRRQAPAEERFPGETQPSGDMPTDWRGAAAYFDARHCPKQDQEFTPMNKPSKPWCVTKHTSRGVLPTTAFRSQRAAYEAVTLGRRGAEAGVTDEVAAVVEQWEDGRWRLFERVDYPQAPQRLAARYRDAQTEHRARPDAPGNSEAVAAAWDAIVDATEAAGHDPDTCECILCALRRTEVGEQS